MVVLEDFLGKERIRVIPLGNGQNFLVAHEGEYPNAISVHSTLKQENPKEYARMLIKKIEHDLKT